jgi:hypothetical protein
VLVSLTALVVIVAGGLTAVVATRSSAPQKGVYPGTLAGPMTHVNLQVVECKSSYGVEYPAGEGPSPVVAQQVRVTIPKTLVGKVSLYSDKFRSIEPMLAPSGWKCTAGVGADGGGSITAVPKGRGSGGEQVNYSFVPACSGCAFDVYCPFVSAAMRTAAQEGSCPMPSDKQRDTVVYQTSSLSEGTIFIKDPPGSYGSLTPFRKPQSRLYVSAGYLSYTVIGENSTQLLACTLPSSETDICRASWKMGFADHEVPRYTYADTTTTTTSPTNTYLDTNASFEAFVVNRYANVLTTKTTIYDQLSDSDPAWAAAKFDANGESYDFWAHFSDGQWVVDSNVVNVGIYFCPSTMVIAACEGRFETESFTYTP